MKIPWIAVPYPEHHVAVAFPLTPSLLRRLARGVEEGDAYAEFHTIEYLGTATRPYLLEKEPEKEASRTPFREMRVVRHEGEEDEEEELYTLRTWRWDEEDFEDADLGTLEDIKAVGGLVKSPGVVYAVKVHVQREVTFERTVYLRAYGGVPSNKAIDAAVRKVVTDDAEREGEEAVTWGRATDIRVINAEVDEMALAVEGVIHGP